MTDIVDRLNGSLSAGYSELRKEAAVTITRLRAKLEAAEKERDFAKTEIARLHDDIRELTDERVLDEEDRERIVALRQGTATKPAPSVPDGWLRAIDEALVTAHIGGANAHDTYEQAKAKLDNLIGFLVDVATDPAVNGGYKLMPIEPTKEIYECFAAYDGTAYSNPFDFDDFKEEYKSAIAAAPEAKR